MSRLHRRLVIVVGKEEVLIIFPDVIDGEATVCFQLCLFLRILLFNPCFDLRPLFIRNMFLIERIEGFPRFPLGIGSAASERIGMEYEQPFVPFFLHRVPAVALYP